jgi:hypothetical protein
MELRENESIVNWLFIRFSKNTIVIELFLIGSVLFKPLSEVNDVDIVQFLNPLPKDQLIMHSKNIKTIKDSFLDVFGKSLHITSFTSNEVADYHRFMSLNESIKII